jgi:hypothetical protein
MPTGQRSKKDRDSRPERRQGPVTAHVETDPGGVWLSLEGEHWAAAGHLETPDAERLVRQIVRALPEDEHEEADEGEGEGEGEEQADEEAPAGG